MSDVKEYAASLFAALEFAATMHRHQRRKGVDASPYINHPIQVAEVLAKVGGIGELSTLMAAVLHDTIEDTDATLDDLTERYGVEVAQLVEEVTDDKSLPKAERKSQQIAHASHLSDPAKMIKLADKICNVRDIGSKPPIDWDEERRRQYFDWAEAVVAGCRGINISMEAYFDQCIQESRATLADWNNQ